MRPITFILFLATIALGCKKTTNNSPARVTTFDFTWNYLPYIPLYANQYDFAFSSSAPSGSTYAWDFGDGGASSSATPDHIYSAIGTYTVSLMINGDAAHVLRKPLNVGAFLPHSFTVSGILFTDSTVFFHSNVLPDSSFLWNFGDGTTSTDSVPSHIFHSPGTYNVKLTINSNASTSVTIPVTICNDPLYTHLITGLRLWHDTARLYLSSGIITPSPKPDVSFGLTYINAAQIAYSGRVMYYSPSYSHDSLLYFESSYTDNTGNTHSLSVSFNPFTNHIGMQQYDRIGAGGYTIEYWNTP